LEELVYPHLLTEDANRMEPLRHGSEESDFSC
jgi:hypothetical protein